MIDLRILVPMLVATHCVIARIGLALGRHVERREQDQAIADGIAHRKANADAVVTRIVADVQTERAARHAEIFDPRVPVTSWGNRPVIRAKGGVA